VRRGWRTGCWLPLVAVGVLASIAPTRGLAASRRAPSAVDALQLVHQDFTVPLDGPWRATLQFPATFELASIDADTTVVVSDYQALTDRVAFWDARDDAPVKRTDSFTVSLDPSAIDVHGTLTSTGQLTLVIPTESSKQTDGALRIKGAGVHPVTVEVRQGSSTVAALTTFLNSIDPAADSTDSLAIGVAMRATTVPVIANDGSIAVSAADRAAYTALADSLTALDTAGPPARSVPARSVPAPSVEVDPSILQALATADPTLFTRLAGQLNSSTMVAAPRLPFDPSAKVPSAHASTYTTLLRDGEDLLTSILPNATVDRAVTFAHSPVSTAGAMVQRDLGARLMVLPYDVYDQLQGSLHGYFDTTQLVGLDLGDNTTLPAAVVDPWLAEQLAAPGADPMLRAVSIAAELSVLGGQIDTTGEPRSRHGIVLSTNDLAPIDPTVLGDLAPILAATPRVHLTDLSNFPRAIDTMMVDGSATTAKLPTEPTVDLSARFVLIDEVGAATYSTASMITTEQPVVAGWLTINRALPSTALSDAQAQEIVDALRSDFDRYRTCVVAPTVSGITLTGKKVSIPFSIMNSCDVPITVLVHLDSPKIVFPDGDQVVQLQPSGQTRFVVRAEARSNGQSSVFLRIFAPARTDGEPPLTPQVVIAARVNSLAGIVQLITGGGLLVVLAWWLRHISERRKARLGDDEVHRHPAASSDGDSK